MTQSALRRNDQFGWKRRRRNAAAPAARRHIARRPRRTIFLLGGGGASAAAAVFLRMQQFLSYATTAYRARTALRALCPLKLLRALCDRTDGKFLTRCSALTEAVALQFLAVTSAVMPLLFACHLVELASGLQDTSKRLRNTPCGVSPPGAPPTSPCTVTCFSGANTPSTRRLEGQPRTRRTSRLSSP